MKNNQVRIKVGKTYLLSLTKVEMQGAGCTLAEEWEGWFQSGRPCCSRSLPVCLVKYHEGFDPQQDYFWAGLQLEPYSSKQGLSL